MALPLLLWTLLAPGAAARIPLNVTVRLHDGVPLEKVTVTPTAGRLLVNRRLADSVTVTIREARAGVNVMCPGGPMYVAVHGVFTNRSRHYDGYLMFRRVGRHEIVLVNRVSLEEYVAGVLQRVVGPAAPFEAKKASAVAVRSRAADPRRAHARWDFCDVEHCAVYRGVDGIEDATQRAVNETVGEVIVFEGRNVPAFYCPACGGHTADPAAVWGPGLLYPGCIRPVADAAAGAAHCRGAPGFNWEWEPTTSEFLALLRKTAALDPGREVTDLRMRYDPHGRVLGMRIIGERTRVVTGEQFREGLNWAAGRAVIRSTVFITHKRADHFRFEGRGEGHGVGLCLYGAAGLARLGKGYREIVQHYFPGAGVEKAVLYAEEPRRFGK